MAIGIMKLHLELPGCTSLKEKRGRIKPLLARLHREFNVSVAESGLNERWQEAEILCVLASNDASYAQRALGIVLKFSEDHFPDLYVLEHHTEVI